eukprot:gnl/TRDRNA2_/TRDRNA2_94669_c0_seq1.p1 gnl/TRDRNA2_/TRDRNA2_94669_c0~~gnl/TRDRNA2_/TRDRNA2_94669_c0_seq1.p1  ORF type:complete len:274 (-),score=27.60 gnl/TRDRNA2_/TRDRNA2_94669_c0_seq1:241-975(-)
MGASASKGLRVEDFAVALDLGPQDPATITDHAVYSLESMLLPDHFVRHRDFELWVDPVSLEGEKSNDFYAWDASFVVVPGLLGHGMSLRAAKLPFHYVRHDDSQVVMAKYDGSKSLRSDATFEARRVSPNISTAGAEEAIAEICLASASCPGKYISVNLDGRLVLDKFRNFNDATHRFRLVPSFVAKLGIQGADTCGCAYFCEEGDSAADDRFAKFSRQPTVDTSSSSEEVMDLPMNVDFEVVD